MCDAALGVGPDLGPCGLEMHARVVGIGELVEHAAFAIALHLLGHVAGVFHAARARREDQLGAKGAHGLCPLDGQVLRHDQQHAITPYRGGHGQRDAGVARSRLDQGVAGADVATLLGAADHAHRGAVLDRAGRVVALELAQNDIAARRAVLAWQALQAHQRRTAYHFFDGGVVDHAMGVLFRRPFGVRSAFV